MAATRSATRPSAARTSGYRAVPHSLDDVLRAASGVTWTVVLVCLAPAVWRLISHRGRHLDALLGLIFLLALNRLSFLLRISPEFSHAGALLLAMALVPLAVWYQRHDA